MSNTATELTDLAPLRHPSPPLAAAKGDDNGRRLGSQDDGAPVLETRNLPSPSTASPVVEKWNLPQSNMFRVAACFWSLMVTGANDAAYGVSLPEQPPTR